MHLLKRIAFKRSSVYLQLIQKGACLHLNFLAKKNCPSFPVCLSFPKVHFWEAAQWQEVLECPVNKSQKWGCQNLPWWLCAGEGEHPVPTIQCGWKMCRGRTKVTFPNWKIGCARCATTASFSSSAFLHFTLVCSIQGWCLRGEGTPRWGWICIFLELRGNPELIPMWERKLLVECFLLRIFWLLL